MMIQQGAPATIVLLFRDFDEHGVDNGPLNLDDAEHRPLRLELQPPRGDKIIVQEEDLSVDDAAAGRVSWSAAPGFLALAGPWHAQGYAGLWPATPVTFIVGGNL